MRGRPWYYLVYLITTVTNTHTFTQRRRDGSSYFESVWVRCLRRWLWAGWSGNWVHIPMAFSSSSLRSPQTLFCPLFPSHPAPTLSLGAAPWTWLHCRHEWEVKIEQWNEVKERKTDDCVEKQKRCRKQISHWFEKGQHAYISICPLHRNTKKAHICIYTYTIYLGEWDKA